MCTPSFSNLGILLRTSMRTIRTIFVLVFFLSHTMVPAVALAETSADLSVTPAVIDEKAKQRDIINESITLTNTSNRLLLLYPSVFDVNTVNGQEVFSYAKDASDLAASLANWIELSRGVIEIRAGESKTIPFTIRVNLNARPGQYHAQLTFSDGGTRAEAEAKRPLVTVAVNLEMLADIKEEMQLSSFSSDNVVLAGDDVVFRYRVQNIGNQELQPTGEIRIYNRRGEEVASVDVNKSGKSIDPSKEAQLASVWSGADGFGKFKALLTVNYGKGQSAAVQDTVFFWIIPWKQLLGLIAASLIAIAFFALHFHRWFEERHLSKLAAAGLLKTHHIAGVPDVATQPEPATLAPQLQPSSPFSPLQWLPSPKKTAARLMSSASSLVSGRRTLRPREEVASGITDANTRPTLKEVLPTVKPLAPRPVRLEPQQTERNSGTIDLKNLRPKTVSEAPSQEGHVINLKNRS